jgi:biotin transport system substrate-specific component
MHTVAANHSRYPELAAAAHSLPGKLAIGLAATAVVAAAAHVAIPLPVTPVPLTLQPLAVLAVGLALGPVAGFFAMLTYLAEGALGLPVFSPTGPGGLVQMLGPTGGFLMAYPLVSAIAGGFTQSLTKHTPRFLAAAIGSTAAVVLLFVAGAGWFLCLTHLPLPVVLRMTVVPFLPGEAIKVLIAAGTYRAIYRSHASI